MSTPATVTTFAPRSSEETMSKLTEAAIADMEERIATLDENYEAGLAAMKADYEMKVATFAAQHADTTARLRQGVERIKTYQTDATAAVDKLLAEVSTARVEAAELVPTVRITEQLTEPTPENPPKFLMHERTAFRSRQARGHAAITAVAIALLAMLGAAIVSVT